MAEFTKEQLIEKLERRLAVTTHYPDFEEAQLDAQIFKIALEALTAGMEQEPVAWLLSGGGAKNNVSFDSGNAYVDPLREVTPLYIAPPAPVSVPAAMEMDDDFDSAFEHGKAVGWNACRAAMLKHSEPFIVTSDHRMMEMPQVEAINAVTAILQGADGTLTNEGTIPVTQFKPVADLYGLTSPTGGETSFTFDAVEARDFIDGGWSCQEYVELGRFQEAMLQNGNSPAQSDCCPEQNYIAPAQDGNSPVIPDGLRLALSNAGIAAPESDEMLAATYEKHIQALVTWVKDRKPFKSAVIPDGWVLVPEEPTHEMLEAGDEQFGTYDVYRRMIAAAPQQEVKP